MDYFVKQLIVSSVFASFASCGLLPVVVPIITKDGEARILAQEQNLNPNHSYRFGFETSNGISYSQASPDGVVAAGKYSYYGPDGALYAINYTADEEGFNPTGAHIPVEPPVPAHVLDTLEKIRLNPPVNDPNFDMRALDSEIARYRATIV